MDLVESMLTLAPAFVQEHFQLISFTALITYVLFLIHWVISTDWESKFNWFSLIIGSTGILYLHYSNVLLLFKYEPFFVTVWVALCFYHTSTWNTNHQKICKEINTIASLKQFDGSPLRFFITLPTTKNKAGQWNPPPFRNGIHVLLMFLYGNLIMLHLLPFLIPLHCRGDASPNCCRYNYVIESFETKSVNMNYCSGPVRIAFAGPWSTGKTSIISALLGHSYSTAQIAPAPSTDKFICLSLGAPYSDPIQSDDYERRQNCDLMSHINDITHNLCGRSLPNVLDIADENQEFKDFVFFDMPGWQPEYGEDCAYHTFYDQLIAKMDFVYVVWDVNHGKIEEKFASFFRQKARGRDYDLIYNRYDRNSANLAFLNQQYGKMSDAKEIISDGYTLKVHENTTAFVEELEQDLKMLRAKILSVNQTVHDNRKMTMKENLVNHRSKITGMQSLRKFKIGDRLIHRDLNIHIKPRRNAFRRFFGIEL